MKFQNIHITDSNSGVRADAFLTEELKISRNQIKKLMLAGHIRVNHQDISKSGIKLKTGDVLSFRIPEAQESELTAQDIELSVIHEDEDLLVINKQAGIVVHPDESGHADGTIVNAVMHHCDNLSGIGGVKRPGIVHRLDKDTSGVLLIAKSDDMHQKLSLAFQGREVRKIYWALVGGHLKSSEGRIDAPIRRHHNDRKRMSVHFNGKEAITNFRVLAQYKDTSLLEVHIETGRTHQIRVHLASIGHPVIGDEKYGNAKLNKVYSMLGLERHFLHAKTIDILDRHYEAELSEDLTKLLSQLS